jgi:thiamine biosynthesis lipoprotein
VPELRFEGIGTGWAVETAEPLHPDVAARVVARVEEFDRTYSRFRADSLVTSFAATGGTASFPPDAGALFDLYDALYERSDGAVTPLVGRSLETLGYDARYALRRRGDAVVAPDWRAVARTGSTLLADEPALLDVGAAGKGYLVDLVGEVLEAHGVVEYVIDASGDILTRGPSALRVGLEHPFDPSLAIGVVEVSDASVCASGSNRRVWGEGLHHILDGRTGEPTRDVVATWAIADSALVADGLATALFFTDPGHLAEVFDFRFVRLFASGQAERSADLPGELFS